MDCCNNEKAEKTTHKGGTFKMERRIVLWIVIGILFLSVLYMTFKAGSSATTSVQSASTVASSAASSYGGMVGGC